jgi:hypothetical protein
MGLCCAWHHSKMLKQVSAPTQLRSAPVNLMMLRVHTLLPACTTIRRGDRHAVKQGCWNYSSAGSLSSSFVAHS